MTEALKKDAHASADEHICRALNSPPCTYQRLTLCARMCERLRASGAEGKGDADRAPGLWRRGRWL